MIGGMGMANLQEISAQLQKGKAKLVKELVQQALEEGISPLAILEEGLLGGMGVIGDKFKRNEVFVPEVLVAARAMNTGVALLKPYLAQENIETRGVAVIGTVQGDLHDIGKNLVKMMLEGKGLTVVDLGVDVSAERFVEAAVENNAQLICCSSLLTTTMGQMRAVVELATEKGLRDQVKIMVGGAPVTQSYCETIGADCYAADAASAADAALAFCKAMI
jgi:corrinoid protein of di/trimethylamine methyltransferase